MADTHFLLEGNQAGMFSPGKKKKSTLRSQAQIQGPLYGKVLHINIHQKHQ